MSFKHIWNFVNSLAVIPMIAMFYVFSLNEIPPWIAMTAVALLGLAVMTAVHHAEVIAMRVGPSFGALILALSVTVIEVGLILSMMSIDSPETAMVARDTVYSAVIIVTNGIMGVCLFLGGLRYREMRFNVGGASSLLAVLAVLSGLTMVLPRFTTTSAGPTYSTSQLIFVSVASLLLYMALVYAQTRSHRDDYESSEERSTEAHERPSRKETWMSFLGLVLSLGVVIGLAKSLSPSIEAGVTALGAPRNVVGIVIALLVLLPETWAAISAARSNQLQTSLNLALGSGAASIALTIPVVSLFSIFAARNLTLGLDDKSVAFLLLTFITGGITLGSGRTTALQGLLHLVLLFAYLAFSFIP